MGESLRIYIVLSTNYETRENERRLYTWLFFFSATQAKDTRNVWRHSNVNARFLNYIDSRRLFFFKELTITLSSCFLPYAAATELSTESVASLTA